MEYITGEQLQNYLADQFKKVEDLPEEERDEAFMNVIHSEAFHAFEGILSQAFSQPVEVDPDEVTDELVGYYFNLIKFFYEGEKPKQVKLDKENCCVVYIDGTEHEFHDYVDDVDADHIEMCMAIEAISCDIYPVAEIEKRLNERIANEW
ncbi:MAG: hypothetical protein NC110_03750 [Ruminococcus sp.]|nr:hypothetical protein [Ruminococcus sp.]